MQDNSANAILVVIPAFNEECCISQVVAKIRQENIGDILVVNDGSTDQTAKIATEAGAMVLNLPFNLGIGGAVQAGLKLAYDMGYSYVARMDGDGQHDPKEMSRLINFVLAENTDVAIGSRFLPGQSTYKPSTSRRLGIYWFAILITLLTGKKVTDPTSGMFVANRRAIKFLSRYYPQDYPEVEARLLMHKARLKVVELPVKMFQRMAGKSSINFNGSLYYVFKVTLAVLMVSIRKIHDV